MNQLILLVVCCWLACGAFATGDDRPPNIVLILADDLGWPHLGCYGATFYETPRIDQLSREGMRFTDFYAAGAVCSPTRASIQSGQYQARLGITDFIPGHKYPHERLTVPPVTNALPQEIVTPAEALKSAGYATGYFGKWHLGRDGDQGPGQQGYDDVVVSSGRHFAPRFRTTPPREVPDGTYLGDFLTDETIRFMTENRERPFFVQLSHYLVHIPLEARPALIERYRNKTAPAGTFHPVYAAMVEHLDDSVGRVLQALDDLKLTDNTLVIFTSDNGGLRQSAKGGEVISDNVPLRNEKGSLYEGGIRVPLIVRWPGVVRPGSECAEPAISIDFWPTLAEVAGIHTAQKQVLDGISLVPLLKDSQAKLDREAIYFHYPHYHHSRPAGAIRAGNWKLIEFFDNGARELYHLREDLGEQKDRSLSEPELVDRLASRLADWRQSVNARMPTLNPGYDAEKAEHEPTP